MSRLAAKPLYPIKRPHGLRKPAAQRNIFVSSCENKLGLGTPTPPHHLAFRFIGNQMSPMEPVVLKQVFAMTYLWLKAGHIIFVIFWMAGLFMLPRYFVYHQEAPAESPENAVWSDREGKLLKIILWPSLVVTWTLGLILAWTQGYFGQGWFHVKLAMVLGLSAYHVWLAGYHKALARGERRLTGKRLRLLNEVPGIAAAVIVVMVVIRPF